MSQEVIRAFGGTVRHFRNRLAITQEELAERAGFHRTYIGQIERAERNPAFKNIVALCQALQVSLVDFFTYYQSLERPVHENT